MLYNDRACCPNVASCERSSSRPKIGPCHTLCKLGAWAEIWALDSNWYCCCYWLAACVAVVVVAAVGFAAVVVAVDVVVDGPQLVAVAFAVEENVAS